MATTFQNQATIQYRDRSVPSNIVTGTINDVLSISKYPTIDYYTKTDLLTFVITLVNSSDIAFHDLRITDDLGAYKAGTPEVSLVPLDYVAGSISYIVDGEVTTAPEPVIDADTKAITFADIDVSARENGKGITQIIYHARPNKYAPLGYIDPNEAPTVFITNTATAAGPGIADPIEATATVYPVQALDVDIVKDVSPSTIAQNGTLTYTMYIHNNGPVDSVTGDNIIVSDILDPFLSPIEVYLGTTKLTANTDYTYTEEGVFTTVANVVTLKAATYQQLAKTNEWVTIPDEVKLTITGTIASKPV